MSTTRKYVLTATILTALFLSSAVQADGVKVIIENRAPNNGTWLTPFWVGFHDGSFDVYNMASAASEELERIAEDGNAEPLSDLFSMGSAGEVQGVIITDETLPPFEPGESAEMTFILDGSSSTSRYFSFLSMVIPSNDAFIGNDSPTSHQIYDGSGNFLGAYFTIYGTDVLDAGTEVNDEIPENTAFFGQMVPNTGVDENGAVAMHPGYLPAGSGGILDNPMFANADFTQPGYEVARITIIRNDTPVSPGNVSGVWDVSGSPYLLEGDVTVPTGQTLTIEPGVTVFSQSWYSITANGHLHAVGTESNPILFTSTPAGPGEPGWKGIRFVDTNLGHLVYCIIENGKVTAGDPFDRGGAVYISDSSPVISHSTLRNNWAGSRGGAIYINQGSPEITNNLIENNLVGYNSFQFGGGIYAIDTDAQIVGNTIRNNQIIAAGNYPSFDADGRGGGIYLNSSSAVVSHNLIVGNSIDVSGDIGSEASGAGIQVWYGSPQLVNNTIVDNSAMLYSSPNHGGGIALYFASPSIVNNIIDGSIGGGIYFDQSGNADTGYNDFYNNDDDFLGSGIPTGLGQITTVNANGDPSDQYYNIFLDPLFVDAMNGDYNLQASSPVIDAGDPMSPPDPDGTIADIGAFYFDQGGMPMVYITLTPYGAPIVIPANGGSFSYNVAIDNSEPDPVNMDVWIMVQLPNGSWFGPVLGPANLTFSGGINIARDRSQDIPAAAPSGTYLYESYVGVYPDVVWQSDSFMFEKSSVGGGASVSGWANRGEGFEQLLTDATVETPAEFNLIGAYPNPFNPVTTIGFSLPEASKITLSVYDINGRLVNTLVDGFRDAGVHQATFDASGLASGVYLYTLQAGSFSAVGKMMLVK